MMTTTTLHDAASSRSPASLSRRNYTSSPLPTVVTLNCIEDPSLEQSSLADIATVDHIPLSRIAQGKIESAAAVLIHSLAYLPRAAQRRLQPYQLVLCLGSADRAVDSALAADLGLRLVHVDVSRAEEVADSIMALFLGLLRRTHLLSRHTLSASGWLGAIQPLCRGMRRCRGLVLGIVGRSASSKSLAIRSLAFKMSVLYFDVHHGSGGMTRSSMAFPPAARRMDTLNDLLAASDLISLHCALTDETVQILSAECLQHTKPGAFLVNTGSSQLLDDCALKQLLIDGTLAGCALDGAEGPQWMEAWVREMPNVLILPRSADYSEEVWMEIREKAISALQSFFVGGVIPNHVVSDEEDAESEIDQETERRPGHTEKGTLEDSYVGQLTEDAEPCAESSWKRESVVSKESPIPDAGLPHNTPVRSEGKRSRSSKKSKKKHARQKALQKRDDPSVVEKESTSYREEDASMSGTDQALSSSSRFASPEDSSGRKIHVDSIEKSIDRLKSALTKSRNSIGPLKDGFVIALHSRDCTSLYVSCQTGKAGGWFLDSLANVTKRDPAAQFLVVFRNKDTIGLRSFSAGGKLLQINRRMEFVFASHSFDVWENWNIEGPLEECRLVNCRNPLATLDVRIEVLALVGEEDGVMRWLN